MNLKASLNVLWPGSYPYLKATQALQLLKKHPEIIAHWPQLPKRNSKELMVEQTLLALKTKDGHFIRGSAQGWAQALRWTKKHPTRTFFKTQIAGPVTMLWKYAVEKGAGQKKRRQKKSTVELLMESLDLWLKHAYWQIQEIKNQNLTPIMILDEPLLPTYLGPASSTRSKKILKVYESIVRRLQKRGAFVGIHCCNRVNISTLIETGAQCIYFDAYHFPSLLKSAKTELQAFLRDGGLIAWGIVPTTEHITPAFQQKLIQTLEAAMHALEGSNLSIHKIAEQSFISPVCGTGLLRVNQAEAVFKSTSDISKMLKKRYKLLNDRYL